MLKSISIGNEDFQDLINTNSYYVDKTKLIEDLIIRNSKVVLFPRPRRFGKTLNMSMLHNFFEITRSDDNKDLFKGLYIESSKYYSLRGTKPVIYLSFKGLKMDDFSSVFSMFKKLIEDLYTEKKYIFDSLDEDEQIYFKLIKSGNGTVVDYIISLKRLSAYLERYHKQKVIMLIDEYDVPIQQGYIKGYYDEVINFIKNMFNETLKTNDSLEFGVMTGVLRVSKESIFSDLNNVDVYGLYNSNFSEYFGFTESDTKELLEYYDLDLNDEVKNMYDGYNFNGVSIYNPWSVLNYAQKKKLNNYWVNTSGNDLIKNMLFNINEDNRNIIESLVQGGTFEFLYNEKLTYKDFDDYENLNTLLNLLFASGYLTIDKPIDEERAVVKMPNNEVKKLITKILGEPLIGSKLELSIYIKNDINNIDLEGLEVHLNKLLESMSYMDSYEAFYHGSMLGLFASSLSSDYIVKSNRETGKGRCDILLERVDKTLGYVLEFKVVNDDDLESVATTALEQIKDKEYYQELVIDKVKDIRCATVIFKNKSCIVRY